MCSIPVLHNIKIRFTVNKASLLKLTSGLLFLERLPLPPGTNPKKPPFKRVRNITTVRRSKYVYNIFESSGTINATGIRSTEEITDCINIICFDCNLLKSDISETIVDNLTASGTYNKEIDLKSVLRNINTIAQNKNQIDACYGRNTYPGVFCAHHGLGTIIVYSNGKYSIVGAKCLEHILRIYKTQLAHI